MISTERFIATTRLSYSKLRVDEADRYAVLHYGDK